MSRFPVNPFMVIVLGLAVLGLGYQLVTNPLGLLTYLLVGAAVAVGMYFLFTRVIFKRSSMSQFQSPKGPRSTNTKAGSPPKKYQKAAKQQQTKNKTHKKHSPKSGNKRRNDHNLTVIEGKKNRKKNRALF
ncbi:tripartite tricarboxylate transporter TctB family protein [Salibacterium salarium]|uniref:Tripartite tricarboxylate transporter TctB family protein n=1 Tax=Salibacterium salarium TaxID=284579 RepID=A0A3R9P1R4_9BACI|nr:tripartite tricarboxylate transporter TctB family protein [Salibacterium salarium]RSL30962.1 tripartite tricarboxylate transporter TctB family protein [Salibacterium salarium]